MYHFTKRAFAFCLMALITVFYALTAKADEPAKAFVLASETGSATFVIEATTDPAISRASDDLRSDIERVSGVRPERCAERGATSGGAIVIAGVVGHSKLLDQLAAAGKLDVAQLNGAWESFVISVVPKPFPGVEQALVIAGSDRRGAIYGIYEVSAMIGVSPWVWWADVAPEKRPLVSVAAGTWVNIQSRI